MNHCTYDKETENSLKNCVHVFCFIYMVLGLHLQGYGLDSHSPQTSSPHPSVRWASSPRKTRPSTSSRAFSGTHQDYLLSSFHSLISNVECLFNNSIAHFFVSWALHIYKHFGFVQHPYYAIVIHYVFLFHININTCIICSTFFSSKYQFKFSQICVYKLIHINIWFE